MIRVIFILVLIANTIHLFAQVPVIVKEEDYRTICIKEYKSEGGSINYVYREKIFTERMGDVFETTRSDEIVKILNGKEDIIIRTPFGTNNESTKHLAPKVVVRDICADTLTDIVYKITSVDGKIMVASYKKIDQPPGDDPEYEALLRKEYKFYRIYADVQLTFMDEEIWNRVKRHYYSSIHADLKEHSIIIELATDKRKSTVSYDIDKKVFEILLDEEIDASLDK